MAAPGEAAAQSAPVVSRPVVQSLPSGNSQRLNGALARIARDPRDYSALIDAGDAANAMGDAEAAAGFYKRADGISPNNPRIKAGMARALVLQGKPTEAIPLFASAEAGGAADDVTSDRGLAYDLVGDTATAQRYYQAALARRDDDEVRRRLGISMAIAGNAAGAESMLMPLLRKQDKPAWRAHAFALAIAGKTKEAVETVNAILPAPLAQSVTPYLRYMPRLTRPQQAAAVNLGKFPRASEIGRDDPVIAAYASSVTRVASADQALVPRGKPLGGGRSSVAGATQPAASRALTGSERRARDKAARLARAEAAQAARVAPPEPMPAIGPDNGGELPALASSTPPTPPSGSVALASRTPAPWPAIPPATTTSMPEPAPQPRQVAAAVRAGQAPVVRTGTLQIPTIASVNSAPRQASAPAAPVSAAATQPRAEVARAIPPQSEPARAAGPGFDLANIGATTTPASGTLAGSTTALATQAVSPAEVDAAAVSLEQAFADLGAPSRAPAPIAGAVDVRVIEPAKPQPPIEVVKLDAKPEVPAKKNTLPRLAEVEAPAEGKAKAQTKQAKAAEAKLTAAAKLAEAKADGKAGASKKGDAKADAKAAEAKKAEAKKADAKKIALSHPSRIWVQVGVGRDKAAIAFDWRKFVKEDPALFKGRQAYVSDMGRTNRILAGPFETQKAANDLLAKLKKANFGGAFIWSSAAGQAVDPLAAK